MNPLKNSYLLLSDASHQFHVIGDGTLEEGGDGLLVP